MSTLPPLASPPTASPLIVYDRSRTVTDWECPRRRFHQYESGGRGLVPGGLALELYLGTAIHDGLAAIAIQWKEGGAADINLISSTAREQILSALQGSGTGTQEEFEFAAEQAALVEGILLGFYRQVWPSLLTRYPKILLVEQEMEFRHDGLVFMSKPDLVLEDLEGEAVYVEYKSTSSKKEEWVNSWNTAVQLHSTIRAIETTLGRKVGSVIVVGLYKGYQSYGKQNSPYCYCYRRAANPPFMEEDLLYEYKAGYKRYPTWDLKGGTREWVEGMPESLLGGQFLQSPPIFVKDHLVDTFFTQRGIRENQIAAAHRVLLDETLPPDMRERLLNHAFPQNFSECTPSFGRACAYRILCHGNVSDPLSSGFQWRESHHELERELQAAALLPQETS